MFGLDLFVLVSMLFLSAFFSSSEIALISISRLKIRHLVEKDVKGAKTLSWLRKNPHRLLINIAIANNIVNIFAASFATSIAIRMFGNYGVGIATGVMTFLILTFGEIIPKTIATRDSERIALRIAPIIKVLSFILFPLIWVFDGLTYLINKKTTDPKVTEEEIKTMISMGEEEGAIETIERDMIHNIFTFNDINAWEVMTPRTDILSIDMGTPLKKIVSLIKKEGTSRIPVYEEDMDHIKGVLYAKDLIPFLNNNKKFNLSNTIRPAYFIPRNKRIDSLLTEFQNKKLHMALVVDEHGGIEGLVTMEDLLEEIIGEIYDESDTEDNLIRKIDKDTFIVKGNTEIDEINDQLNLNLKGGEDSNTISGLILDNLGRIPKKGESIKINKFEVIIFKTDRQRIEEIKIVKK